MTQVMNLGVPSWGGLGRDDLTIDDGELREDFIIPTPTGDVADHYFTLDEYAQFAWYFPSTIFFFSEGQFTYRVFTQVMKPLGFVGELDSVVQEFVSSVHDESLLPKSDKATKLARELKPLKNLAADAGFDDLDACRLILSLVLQFPECPTRQSMDRLAKMIDAAHSEGVHSVLSRSISEAHERLT